MLPPIGTSDHCQIEFSVFSLVHMHITVPIIDHDPSANIDEVKLNDLPIFDWNNATFDALSKLIEDYN